MSKNQEKAFSTDIFANNESSKSKNEAKKLIKIKAKWFIKKISVKFIFFSCV